MNRHHVFGAVYSILLAIPTVAQESATKSSLHCGYDATTNDSAIAIQEVGLFDNVNKCAQNFPPESRTDCRCDGETNDISSALREIGQVSTNTYMAVIEKHKAISETNAMVKTVLPDMSNRVKELIELIDARMPEVSQEREYVREEVVRNIVSAIEPRLTSIGNNAEINLTRHLEHIKSDITMAVETATAAALRAEKDYTASHVAGWSLSPKNVLYSISLIVLLAILALTAAARKSVYCLGMELSEGKALLLNKLPIAVSESLRSRFEDMAKDRSRADDQFNDLANAIGDLKEMVRVGLKPGETPEMRRMPPAPEFGSGIPSREEEERLHKRTRELEMRLREKDAELSGMKDLAEDAMQKMQLEVKAAQENEARTKKELDQASARLAEATARPERQSASGLSFLEAEAFKKIKADLEDLRGKFPDEVAVVESALSLVHLRKLLSKGTWSSALRDIAATVSGVLEKRGAFPEAVRQTLNDWSKALERLAQPSLGGTFALSVPQIGDQVDSSWMTTVGGSSPSRVGGVKAWAVYIDGKIQCYAEVK